MAKATLSNMSLFFSKLDLNFRKKLVKCYVWSTTVCVAEKRSLRKVDQKIVESLEMRCWRRTETISWIDCVKVRRCYILPRRKGTSYF
jgi:hypothetical protein